MKRVLFLFAALILVSGLSFGTIFYVDYTLGNDSWDGLAPAYVSGTNGPWKTVAKVNALSFSAGDSVLFKRGETWSGTTLTLPSSGTSESPILIGAYGTGNKPILIRTGAAIININAKNYVSISSLCLSGNSEAVYINSSGIKLYNIDAINGAYIYCEASTSCEINYVNVVGAGNHGITVKSSSTGTTINYSLVKGAMYWGIRVQDAPSTIINNCNIAANAQGGIKSSGVTTTLTVNNCIVEGNVNSNGTDYYGLQCLSGSLAYRNCLITGNNPSFVNKNLSSGVTDGGGNIIGEMSGITAHVNNTGYFILTSDDHDVAYWKDIAATLLPYGGHFTAFLNSTVISEGEKADLVTLAAAGHEMAVHGWSHSLLTATTLFAVTSTNTNPTVDVDVPGSQILLSCDEVGNRVTFSWTGGKTITDLKAAVVGKGWTITTTTNVNDLAKLSGLADSSGTHACPYSPIPDVVTPNYQYWANEILDTKDWITTNVGITPTTMSYPYGSRNANLDAWLIGKLDGGRSTNPALYNLSSIQIYDVRLLEQTTFVGARTEAAIRFSTRHFYTNAKHTGVPVVLLTHIASNFTIQQIGWMVDELYKIGGQLKTFGEVIAAIRADHSTADNITYTKTYPDVSDFHLLPGSPCINAGTDVGLTQDYEGKRVPRGSAPDIGAYEYFRSKAILFLRPR